MSAAGIIRARILGCGSSGGVPRVDGDWGACDPKEPKNYRLRCSLLVEKGASLEALKAGEATRLLIDTTPDLRAQLLAAGSPMIDALAFTHDHADQTHGIDDVRALVYRRGARLPAWMDAATGAALRLRFAYIFETPAGSGYPPLLEPMTLADGEEVSIDGAGGPLALTSFTVGHGSIDCAGVRVGPLAYTPDVDSIPETGFAALEGVTAWIVDALREKPHPSHAHLGRALEWLERVNPALGLLTNLHIDMDYRTLLKRCPDGVRPAYDGLSLVMDADTGEIVHVDRP
ncbi:phosphoribosyl 1,2-cyclic phosphodiesterase [Marinicauda salina]|uniref:Phosphoribosyl 1,2-cyclic phosphodiesterase n=1 Tax=Marinicauda salina TaxID=2135793 RepID=A0A2U2BT38_9PROT|nr:MBL fold metallo-hydrolase [Marinicauda salina]PWE17189.1 phosphoribosyl 1,2-cyclic phosphodiesterase [Marinicauda salina]